MRHSRGEASGTYATAFRQNEKGAAARYEQPPLGWLDLGVEDAAEDAGLGLLGGVDGLQVLGDAGVRDGTVGAEHRLDKVDVQILVVGIVGFPAGEGALGSGQHGGQLLDFGHQLVGLALLLQLPRDDVVHGGLVGILRLLGQLRAAGVLVGPEHQTLQLVEFALDARAGGVGAVGEADGRAADVLDEIGDALLEGQELVQLVGVEVAIVRHVGLHPSMKSEKRTAGRDGS